jgi:adenylate kinase family enzyme
MGSLTKIYQPGRRIAVIGVTGSGKTTMASKLARALGLAHVELDALHWEPGWEEAPLPVFRERVEQALLAPGWVTDGNYAKVRDIIWRQADTVVWLDYPFLICLWRLTRRSFRRVARHEQLWNTNVESWRGMFFSKDSLFLWLFKTHPQRRREYPLILAQPENSHLALIRLKSPRQADAWLAAL